MMTFNALYFTENEDDAEFRVIEAASLQEAKEILKAQILAEDSHGAYYLDSLVETKASYDARKAI